MGRRDALSSSTQRLWQRGQHTARERNREKTWVRWSDQSSWFQLGLLRAICVCRGGGRELIEVVSGIELCEGMFRVNINRSEASCTWIRSREMFYLLDENRYCWVLPQLVFFEVQIQRSGIQTSEVGQGLIYSCGNECCEPCTWRVAKADTQLLRVDRVLVRWGAQLCLRTIAFSMDRLLNDKLLQILLLTPRNENENRVCGDLPLLFDVKALALRCAW